METNKKKPVVTGQSWIDEESAYLNALTNNALNNPEKKATLRKLNNNFSKVMKHDGPSTQKIEAHNGKKYH